MGSCLSSPENRSGQSRLRLSNRNPPCAFMRLPVEIHVLIIHSLRSELTRERQLAQMRVLAAVCKNLRSVVLHEPRFWQSISVRGALALHDLSYALLRGYNGSVELGIDFSERRGPHPVDECSPSDVRDTLELVTNHMHRIRVLSISLHNSTVPLLKLLSSEATSLEELYLSVYRATIFASESDTLVRIFSGVAPRLRILSIAGIFLPVLPAGLLGSLQAVTLRGMVLPSLNLRHLLSNCSPTLRELNLRNCRMVNHAVSNADRQYPLALETLSLDGVEGFRFDTAMYRSRTIILEMLYWSTMGANARTCFNTLGELKTLELLRSSPYDGSLPTVIINAETESGLKRRVVCFFQDSDQSVFGPVVLGVAGASTVRFLVLTLEWLEDFARYASVSCELVEELTLIHGSEDKFYFSTLPDWHGRNFPFLRRIVLDVHDIKVAEKIFIGVKIVLRRLINRPTWWEELLEVRPRNVTLEE